MIEKETSIIETKEKKDLPKKEKTEVPEHIKRRRNRHRKVKNIIFGFIWLYFIVSIFITNIDSLIIVHFNLISLTLYSTLRFLIILLTGFTTWIFIGNKRFWKNLGLFFLFPFYPGVWIFVKWIFVSIPKFLVKRRMTIMLYYYAEYIVNFLVEFKFAIIKIALFVTGFIIMFRFDSLWLLISILIFSFLQISHLYGRFKQAFSPIKVFRISLDEIEEVSQKPLSPEKLSETISDSKLEDEKTDEEKLIKEMEFFLIINEFTKDLNLKLKEIINRRVYFLSFLGKTIYSLLLSMLYFGAINYCIFKMNNAHYSFNEIPNFFDFFYYSFFTIFPNGTDIIPITVLSKSIRMAGVMVGVIINLLLITVYLTISNERFKENLERLLNFTDNYSKGINGHFEKKYGNNPTEALKKLRGLGSEIEGVMKLIKTFMNIK